MTPTWRWWLFCAAVNLTFATRWEWPRRLMGWCVLPEWLGWDPANDSNQTATGGEAVPF